MSFNSSTSGKQRYRAALALTLAFGITSAILANSHAQTAGDPGLLEAIRAFEETLRQKDIERVLGAWQFESPGARSDEEIALRDAFWADAVTLTSDVTAMSVERWSSALR